MTGVRGRQSRMKAKNSHTTCQPYTGAHIQNVHRDGVTFSTKYLGFSKMYLVLLSKYSFNGLSGPYSPK